MKFITLIITHSPHFFNSLHKINIFRRNFFNGCDMLYKRKKIWYNILYYESSKKEVFFCRTIRIK